MASRPARSPGKRPARPAQRPTSRPAPAPPAEEAPRVSSASVAVFLSVLGLLASLVFWPLSIVLGAAGAVVALLALRRGQGARPVLLLALALGLLAVLLSALGVYLQVARG